MGARRANFTQLDVQRAVRGAKAAGVQPDEVRISPGGEIRILFRNQDLSTETAPEVLDELARHFGDERR